jgi:Flp pilus assembly protein TadG
MGAWHRLKSLFRSDRGNVLMIGAAAMPLLMGSAGLAIDTIQLAFWKRQIQRAADSAALAGAHARVQASSTAQAVSNDLDENIDFDLQLNETPILSSTVIEEGSFAESTFATANCATRGATGVCHNPAIQVTLTSQRRLPFMGLFTHSPSTITARATAAVIESGRFCLVSLYDGTDPGITGNGNINLDLGCGMVTNSRSANAVNINGNSADIDATPISAVGGLNADDFPDGTTTLPYSAAFPDPFATIPDPEIPDNCGGTLLVTSDTQINPGDKNCYDSVHVKSGTLTVNTDQFFVRGMLNLDSLLKSGTNGTTLFLMGDDSDMTTNGGGQSKKLDLTAPSTGPYAGIALFRDRNAATRLIKMTGGTDITIDGAIYAPSTDLSLGGNGEIGSRCVQIVGRKLTFHGNPELINDCDDPNDGYKTQIVRLVD